MQTSFPGLAFRGQGDRRLAAGHDGRSLTGKALAG
jgi:hypothetical protein